jgi:hypothetical protein
VTRRACGAPLMSGTAFRVVRDATRTRALGRHGFAVLFVRFQRDVWDQPHALHASWSVLMEKYWIVALLRILTYVINDELLRIRPLFFAYP